MVRSFIVGVALVAGTIGLPSSGAAAPILFDEQIGGDDDLFPGGDGFFVGDLDVGVNVVLGRSYDLMGLFPDFQDHIRFGLPVGLIITDIELSVTGYSDSVAGNSSIGLQSPSSGTELFNTAGTVVVDPFAIVGSTVVVELTTPADPESGNPIWFDSYNYTLSLTVDYVPEPSTGLLVGLGLVGIAANRRRVAGA